MITLVRKRDKKPRKPPTKSVGIADGQYPDAAVLLRHEIAAVADGRVRADLADLHDRRVQRKHGREGEVGRNGRNAVQRDPDADRIKHAVSHRQRRGGCRRVGKQRKARGLQPIAAGAKHIQRLFGGGGIAVSRRKMRVKPRCLQSAATERLQKPLVVRWRKPLAAHTAVDFQVYFEPQLGGAHHRGEGGSVSGGKHRLRDIRLGERDRAVRRRVAQHQNVGAPAKAARLQCLVGRGDREKVAPRTKKRGEYRRRAVSVGVRLHDGDDARVWVHGLRLFAQQTKIADKRTDIQRGKAAIRGKAGLLHSAPFCYHTTIFVCFQGLFLIFSQFLA